MVISLLTVQSVVTEDMYWTKIRVENEQHNDHQKRLIHKKYDALFHTLPMPHLVNISAVTLPTPPMPTTATEKSRILCFKTNKTVNMNNTMVQYKTVCCYHIHRHPKLIEFQVPMYSITASKHYVVVRLKGKQLGLLIKYRSRVKNTKNLTRYGGNKLSVYIRH
jgi:hypothetical protein